ncbi:hypothetical protein PLCT2_02365 [Planctomycetaceae bacterium]|nr:hypothetical protein PLCT2_02365 [Planctomycetaceae bacterium]
MDWQQLLLNPDKADLDALSTLAICAPLVLVGAFFVWRLIARMGPSGGALSMESFFFGVPLALAGLMLPDLLLYLVYRGSYAASRADFAAQHGVLQLIVAGTAIYVLRHHAWEPRASTPRVWTRVQPLQLLRTGGIWLLATPLIFASIIGAVAAAQWLGAPIEQQPVLKELTARSEPAAIAGAYLMAVVGVPLAEEFAFRVVLFGGLRGLLAGDATRGPGLWAAFVISIFLFVLVHGMWRPNMLYLAAPLTLLSIFLTLIYAHTRSLWPGVLFHALHNGLVLTLQFTLD